VLLLTMALLGSCGGSGGGSISDAEYRQQQAANEYQWEIERLHQDLISGRISQQEFADLSAEAFNRYLEEGGYDPSEYQSYQQAARQNNIDAVELGRAVDTYNNMTLRSMEEMERMLDELMNSIPE
ncbi:MAG: hypothetical protein J6Y94_07530, partial [Bacteriovoracaceae bacterium]|nr:hypothetical protein [Bacteriovoracaceae bacterium]